MWGLAVWGPRGTTWGELKGLLWTVAEAVVVSLKYLQGSPPLPLIGLHTPLGACDWIRKSPAHLERWSRIGRALCFIIVTWKFNRIQMDWKKVVVFTTLHGYIFRVVFHKDIENCLLPYGTLYGTLRVNRNICIYSLKVSIIIYIFKVCYIISTTCQTT